MYRKPEFEPRSRADIEQVIRANPFALLITVADGAPLLTHLPFVYETDRGERGTLVSHLAAANPQVSAINANEMATIVFSGVHGYISPSWLSERSHTAPTWNYEVVECRGRLHELNDNKEAIKAVAKLVNQQEADNDNRWRMGELGRAGIERRMPKIVCFELPIDNWQAKFKMHQDEWASDTRDVCPHLRERGDSELAERMELFNAGRLPTDESE